MRADLWSDFICPWCYAAQDRTARLVARGVPVTLLPYELHPEIPPEGRDLRDARPGGRTDAVYSRIEAECADVGLPFNRPRRVPSSRLALEVSDEVRRTQPDAFEELARALFRAHFVDGEPIDDAGVVRRLVEGAGADPDPVFDAVERGVTRTAVDASMAAALDAGVAGTPAYQFDGGLLLPGLQPVEVYDRIVTKLQSRAAG